jgi:hypothetical protein
MTGFGEMGPAGFVQNDFHWRDLAFNRGSHAFKAGFDIYRDQDIAPFTGPTLRPSFQFADVFGVCRRQAFRRDEISTSMRATADRRFGTMASVPPHSASFVQDD